MKFADIEGKTIKTARKVACETSDDEGWLLLEFTDGTKCTIVAGYGEEYTGNSEGEYPTSIGISDETDGFAPVGCARGLSVEPSE